MRLLRARILCIAGQLDATGRIREIADCLHQPSLLIVELVVIRSVLQESWQKLQKPLLVHNEELLHFR